MSAGSCKSPIRGIAPPLFGQFLTERKLRGLAAMQSTRFSLAFGYPSRQVAPLMGSICGGIGCAYGGE
jgi:hypothetical protein